MSRVLIIVAQDGFRDEEYSVPRQIIEGAGHEVKVASMTRNKASGMLGMSVQPDIAIHEVNPEFFDAFLMVGGKGVKEMKDDEELLSLLEHANVLGKKIFAICLGPMVLANAGVLSHKNATVFSDKQAIAALRNGGALYREQDVVREGRIVTACGPQAAEKFGKMVVEVLEEE
jgi:protease I